MLRVVLVRTKEPGNIGSSARAMKNFGLRDLYLVAPQRKLNTQAYALATHAADILEQAVICDTLEDALKGCQYVLGTTARLRKSESQHVYTPRQAAEKVSTQGNAIVFGPEDFGLSNEDLDLCQGYIRIPTGNFASLNLAQAVNIVAYEWFLATTSNASASPLSASTRAANREQYEAMYDQLRPILHQIGFTDQEREASAMRIMRGIFDRAALSERELAALRGLWSRTAWTARELHKCHERGANTPDE